MSAPLPEAERPLKPMQILSLGMTRTGSASITQALTILGYRNVHHGIQAISNPNDWAVFSRACDSLFPTLPTYTGWPFTRAEWDQVFSSCEAVTDMASFFALPLVEAYPDAKIILVERDVEQWYASMEEAIFSTTWGWRADLIINVLGRLMGLAGGLTIRKIMLGFYEARDVHEMRRKARDRYRRHYAEIRAAIPKERILEYGLDDGWGPLCAFLGRPVPDVPFPHANKRKEHVARVTAKQNQFLKLVTKRFAKKTVPVFFTVLAASLGVWGFRNQHFIGKFVGKYWK